MLFADAANLDDFISHVTIIHTDEPTENISESESDANLISYAPVSYSSFPDNGGVPNSIRILFDQDSPSLTPEYHYVIEHNSENKNDKKLILISVSIHKTLYLEYHSILI